MGTQNSIVSSREETYITSRLNKLGSKGQSAEDSEKLYCYTNPEAKLLVALTDVVNFLPGTRMKAA